MSHSFQFTPKLARRIPDPNFHGQHAMERLVMFMRIGDVPRDLPDDANARTPNTNKQVYREVEASMLDLGENVEGTFHLKHKGITVVAESFKKRGRGYEVFIGSGQGILDGGHTYEIIQRHINGAESHVPEDQFVKFEILTHVPSEWVPAISGGLNTSVQVQEMSLANLRGDFDWLKDELAGPPYDGQIAWREGEKGEYSARDVIALMTCFCIDRFPNEVGKVAHPVVAYEKASKALDLFEQHPDEYRKLQPILREILDLYERIRCTSRDLYNVGAAGRRGGRLAFVEKREAKGKKWPFPLIDEENEYRLMKGAAFPILAAFRWMVEPSESGARYQWRGGYRAVTQRWQDLASQLIEMTQETSSDLGRKPDAIGKSRNHWSNLHSRVAFDDLMRRR